MYLPNNVKFLLYFEIIVVIYSISLAVFYPFVIIKIFNYSEKLEGVGESTDIIFVVCLGCIILVNLILSIIIIK